MNHPSRLSVFLLTVLVGCSQPPPPATQTASPAQEEEASPAFRDASLPVAQHVEDLLGRLTLPEKAALLIDKAEAVERLGIPKYDAWNEALHGVAWRHGVTVFPQAIGLASTWDPELMHRVATAISTEARALYNAGSFGLTLWSPVINIARDPRWGRTQEAYGEDPLLTSRMAVAYVKGVQGDDPFYLRAVATPKHFALNNVEATRFTGSSDVPEELIRDYYLPHFRAAVVEGGARSIMCAYNRINGVPSCGNSWLLDTVLRKEWGFDGFVVSDCGAIESMVWGQRTEKSDSDAVVTGLEAGCDLACGKAYATEIAGLVQRGKLTEVAIDRALSRVLTARFRLGMFDPPEKNPYGKIPLSVVDSVEHRTLAHEAAQKSLVLLKNEGLLPLDAKKTKNLALIGPAAGVFLHGSQGYHGTNDHQITPLAAFEKRKSDSLNVSFVPGTVLPSGAGYPTSPVPESLLKAPQGEAGLRAEYFSNVDLSGTPALTRTEKTVDFDWGTGSPGGGVPSDNFSARFTGTFTPDKSGHYLLSVTGDDGYRLSLDGKVFLEDWTEHAPRTRGAVATLEGGRAYEIKLEYFERGGGAALRFSHAFVEDGKAEAVAAARKADAVVFFAGVDELAADEEKDFASLSLPKDQSQLLEAVIQANPRTILVILSGNPLVLSASEKRARGIIQAWYPGQDTGTALAELVFGDFNPSGRLPITFYSALSDLPPMEDYDIRKGRTYMYLKQKPLFPFGHGLSYTTFEYRDLSLSAPQVVPTATLRVDFELENTGARAGEEVVQVYVRPQKGPQQVLRAFRRVALDQKKKERVSIELKVSDLAHYDVQTKSNVVDPGEYEVLLGSSSADIRQRAKFSVSEQK